MSSYRQEHSTGRGQRWHRVLILGKQAVTACHHRVHSCGFPLLCHNHSNHHHNPSQPGLLGCITELCHSTPSQCCLLFFLLSQIAACSVLQPTSAELHTSKQAPQCPGCVEGEGQSSRQTLCQCCCCGCSPGALPAPLPLGPRLSALEHAAFPQGQGAVTHWAGSQICSQGLIHNSWRILFWKGCSG